MHVILRRVLRLNERCTPLGLGKKNSVCLKINTTYTIMNVMCSDLVESKRYIRRVHFFKHLPLL